MKRLLTAALLLVTSAGLNVLACGSCKQTEKPSCVKEVTVKKHACPQRHTAYSCPDGYREEGKEEQQHSGKKNMNNKKQNGKPQKY